MPGPFYIALLYEPEAFNPAVHNVEDMAVFNFTLEQNEGDFASLKLVIANPYVGLLNQDAPLWVWFSWFDGASIKPLFLGRLVGVPEDLHAEVVSITYLGRPDDYDDRKVALAATLRTLPEYDPIFVQSEQRDNPDVVLEARSALWHVDRVTHAVSISNIVEGEDGTATVSGHFYDSLKVSYREAPATAIDVKATVSWKQQGTGEVDLTGELYKAFFLAKSAESGYITSYTGGGLISSWPVPGATIGAGWTVGTSFVQRVDGFSAPAHNYVITVATGGVVEPAQSQSTQVVIDLSLLSEESREGWTTVGGDPAPDHFTIGKIGHMGNSGDDMGGPMNVGFPEWCLRGAFAVDYAAMRPRVEVLSFTLEADVQPLLSEDVEALSIDLSSQEVDQPVDAGGALPIGDLRRSSYFKTDRGQQSVRHLIMRGAAHLMARARAVTVACEIPFSDAVGLTLRQSRTIDDPRLPGGQATGKVTSYNFGVDGDSGSAKGGVSLGCTIGHGATLTLPAGAGLYVEDAYVAAAYQAHSGGIAVLPEVYYNDFSSAPISDDGIDLFDVRPPHIIELLYVRNGSEAQEHVLEHGPSMPGESEGNLYIYPPSLPAVTPGVAYTAALLAFGGTAPYTFGLNAGSLPAGLSLSTTGVISGTPTAGTTSTVTIAASDSSAGFATRTYQIGSFGSAGWVSDSTPSFSSGGAGVSQLKTNLIAGGYQDTQAAITALNEVPTQIALRLKQMNPSEPFTTNFALSVSLLAVPVTVDLEAEAAP